MKKIDHIKSLLASGKEREALELAAKLPTLGVHKRAISQGFEAIRNPSWYIQLRKDPEALIKAGIEAVRDRFEKENYA